MSGERFYFNPLDNQNFTFRPVLDGIAYEAEIKWTVGRWWLFIAGYCNVPIVSSPDNHDIQLVNHSQTNIVYRASCQSFEVGFTKKTRWIDRIKQPVVLIIQDNCNAENLMQDFGNDDDILKDIGI